MPSAWFYVKLHRYVNTEMRHSHLINTFRQPSARFYRELQRLDLDYFPIAEVRECYRHLSWNERQFLLMEVDFAIYWRERGVLMTPNSFSEYWETLDRLERREHILNFPRHSGN